MSKLFKSVHKSASKVAKKVDGHMINLANSVTTRNAVPSDLEHGSSMPELLEAPSFATNVEEPPGSAPELGVIPSIDEEGSVDSDLPEQTGPWWQQPSCDYLCITVRRARNLPIMDFESRGSHSFVRATVGSVKGGGTYYTEQTRVVRRSRYPMWQQSFFFPMQRLTGETSVCLSVFHESAIMKREDFIGQVGTTLSQLLGPVGQMMEPFTRWYRLAGKKSEGIVGDLQFSVNVIPKVMHIRAVPLTRDLFNTEKLLEQYGDRTLKITLIGLKNLKVNPKAFSDPAQDLSITFKLSRCQVTTKLNPKAVEGLDSLTISLDEEVLIPLAETYEGRPTKKSDEIAEIKIYLKLGEDTVCRTQVPIWDVPFCRNVQQAGNAEHSPVEMRRIRCASQAGAGSRLFQDDGSSSNDVDNDPLGMSGKSAGILEEEEVETAANSNSSKTSVPGSGQKNLSSFLGAMGNVSSAVSGTAMKFATDVASYPMAVGRSTHSSSGGDDSEQVKARPGVAMLSRSSAMVSLNSGSRSIGPETLDTLFTTLNSPVGDNGRTYKQTMSVATADILLAPELEFSMFIVPKQDEKAVSTEIITLDAEEDDDGETSITPITAPAPLDVAAVSLAVAGKPNAVFNALTDADSEYLKGVMGSEALRDIKIAAWESAPSVGPTALTRKVTYVRPLNIPMAPKQCDVEEIHTVTVKEAGGFVLERRVSTNAPKGDAFYVQIQDVGVWDPASKSTHFSTTFKVEITKSLGMLKSIVVNGATGSTKSGATKWAQQLAKYMATRTGVDKSRSVGGAPVAAGGGEPSAAPSQPSGGITLPSIPIPSLKTMEKVLRMLSFLILALGFYHMARGIAGIGTELINLLVLLVQRDFKLAGRLLFPKPYIC